LEDSDQIKNLIDSLLKELSGIKSEIEELKKTAARREQIEEFKQKLEILEMKVCGDSAHDDHKTAEPLIAATPEPAESIEQIIEEKVEQIVSI